MVHTVQLKDPVKMVQTVQLINRLCNIKKVVVQATQLKDHVKD